MHLIVADHDWMPPLQDELLRSFPDAKSLAISDTLLQIDGPTLDSDTRLAFARQLLPNAVPIQAKSVKSWAEAITTATIDALAESNSQWTLHLEPRYGEGKAGRNRCDLIRKAIDEILRKKRRSMVRNRIEPPSAFDPGHALVQCILTDPENGWLSVLPAPYPYELRALVAPFPLGFIPIAEDKTVPSRAFSKLVEAELRLGFPIQKGDQCVDLGASPGSWSAIALRRGAHVTAIDRSPLRADLMNHRKMTFVTGDAFKYEPSKPVDWLLCDVIAAPQRSMDLLLHWLGHGFTRHFVLTIKLKGAEDYPLLAPFARAALPLCKDFRLSRLCANKNEVCAFGTGKA